MPLKKIQLKSGVNRENTKYSSEGGWYECDKIRFRQGTPEAIGGWQRVSDGTFLGTCRSLWVWTTLNGVSYTGVGTHLKFYVERGGAYSDITPLRTTVTLTNPFTATNGSSVITVAHTAHGCLTGDFVTYSGAAGLGGAVTAGVLNQEHQVTVLNVNTYTITLGVTATAADAAGSPGGGASVSAAYQINVGAEYQVPLTGWGAGGWASGPWGVGTPNGGLVSDLRLWTQDNYGEDLVFAVRNGPAYFWDSSAGFTTRAVPLTSLVGASDTPTVMSQIVVSDISRFVLALGANPIGSATQDPLLIRWADQETLTDWTPLDTNQAGDIRLSSGSYIVTSLQVRQEILVWTDSTLYGLQYLGPPDAWAAQLLGDNISIVSPNAAALASGIVFWMGSDKFYMFDGAVKTLNCDLRQYVFDDFDRTQTQQVFAGTNEGFNEVWWFYCSSGSTTIDRYVTYNYLENVWYYGTMERTAWLDTGLKPYPLAATYAHNLVQHELGVDDATTSTPAPIHAYIQSAQFDIDDGHNFSFIRRVLPDITFRGSTAGSNPQATLTLYPLKNSGSGYNAPMSVGGNSTATITQTASAPVEEFTGQVFIRVRGRQMAIRVESNKLGTHWQLGYPRVDLRPDGRK